MRRIAQVVPKVSLDKDVKSEQHVSFYMEAFPQHLYESIKAKCYHATV